MNVWRARQGGNELEARRPGPKGGGAGRPRRARVLTGSEIYEDRPNEWVLEAYLPRRPTKAERAAVAALFDGQAPELAVEKLPDTDWLTEKQKGTEQMRAGRFHRPVLV